MKSDLAWEAARITIIDPQGPRPMIQSFVSTLIDLCKISSSVLSPQAREHILEKVIIFYTYNNYASTNGNH